MQKKKKYIQAIWLEIHCIFSSFFSVQIMWTYTVLILQKRL